MHLFREAERLAVVKAVRPRKELVAVQALAHLPFKVEGKKSAMRLRQYAPKSERTGKNFVKDLLALPFAVPNMRRVAASRQLKAVPAVARARISADSGRNRAGVVKTYRQSVSRAPRSALRFSPMVAGFFIPTSSKISLMSKTKKKKFFDSVRTVDRLQARGFLPRSVASIKSLNRDEVAELLNRKKIYSFRANGTMHVDALALKRRKQGHRKIARVLHKVPYSLAFHRLL